VVETRNVRKVVFISRIEEEEEENVFGMYSGVVLPLCFNSAPLAWRHETIINALPSPAARVATA
jgi:hypothetical protein